MEWELNGKLNVELNGELKRTNVLKPQLSILTSTLTSFYNFYFYFIVTQLIISYESYISLFLLKKIIMQFSKLVLFQVLSGPVTGKS